MLKGGGRESVFLFLYFTAAGHVNTYGIDSGLPIPIFSEERVVFICKPLKPVANLKEEP